MLKFIIPAVLVFLTVLFWEKINQKIYQKFNIKINLIILTALILLLAAILILLYFWFGWKILIHENIKLLRQTINL